VCIDALDHIAVENIDHIAYDICRFDAIFFSIPPQFPALGLP
jgi:hypothetical protein